MPDLRAYVVTIAWSDTDKCWIADIPALKYCSAHGDTISGAAAEAERALLLWLETEAAA